MRENERATYFQCYIAAFGSNLREVTIAVGYELMLERPAEVNAAPGA